MIAQALNAVFWPVPVYRFFAAEPGMAGAACGGRAVQPIAKTADTQIIHSIISVIRTITYGSDFARCINVELQDSSESVMVGSAVCRLTSKI